MEKKRALIPVFTRYAKAGVSNSSAVRYFSFPVYVLYSSTKAVQTVHSPPPATSALGRKEGVQQQLTTAPTRFLRAALLRARVYIQQTPNNYSICFHNLFSQILK